MSESARKPLPDCDNETTDAAEDLPGSQQRDVTLLCAGSNVVSHPTLALMGAEIDSFRKSLAELSRGELKERYAREYNCWRAMKERASNGKCTVAEELKSFKGFMEVLGPMPKPTMTVDRIDNNRKEYCTGNVRWATKKTQANNRSNTIILTDGNGVSRPLTEWAKLTNQKDSTMRQRRHRGWSDTEVIAGQRKKSAASRQGKGKAFWPVPEQQKDAWEHAYKKLRKQYKYHPGFTRRVFLTWMLRNRKLRYEDCLERCHPDEFGPNANPQAEPTSVLSDSRYELWKNCQKLIERHARQIEGDKHENEMLRWISQRRDRPFEPWQLSLN